MAAKVPLTLVGTLAIESRPKAPMASVRLTLHSEKLGTVRGFDTTTESE